MKEEQEGQQEEFLNMRSRGINANEVFNSKDRVVQLQKEIDPNNNQALRDAGFQFTDQGIPFRKMEVQGKAIEYQVLSKERNQLQSARTGADYLSEGLRTIAIQTREIIGHLIELQKIIKARDFEGIPALVP